MARRRGCGDLFVLAAIIIGAGYAVSRVGSRPAERPAPKAAPPPKPVDPEAEAARQVAEMGDKIDSAWRPLAKRLVLMWCCERPFGRPKLQWLRQPGGATGNPLHIHFLIRDNLTTGLKRAGAEADAFNAAKLLASATDPLPEHVYIGGLFAVKDRLGHVKLKLLQGYALDLADLRAANWQNLRHSDLPRLATDTHDAW